MLDAVVSVDGLGPVATAPFSTTGTNELLLAFASSDAHNLQTVTISGGGLSWTLVQRANGSPGTAEIWKAVAPGPLANVVVQSVQAETGMRQSLTVMAFLGAGGTGCPH